MLSLSGKDAHFLEPDYFNCAHIRKIQSLLGEVLLCICFAADLLYGYCQYMAHNAFNVLINGA